MEEQVDSECVCQQQPSRSSPSSSWELHVSSFSSPPFFAALLCCWVVIVDPNKHNACVAALQHVPQDEQDAQCSTRELCHLQMAIRGSATREQ